MTKLLSHAVSLKPPGTKRADQVTINLTDPSGKCIEDLCIGEAIVAYELIEVAVAAVETSSVALEATAVAESSSAITAVAGEQVFEIGLDPLANTIARVGIPGLEESPVISGSRLLEIPEFTPTLASRSANIAVAGATAAAGMLDTYGLLK